MAADFPTSIPSIVRVLPGDLMDGPGTEADVLHNDLADEVEALATVLGVTGSVVSTTVEARITALQSVTAGFSAHDHTGGDGGQIDYTSLSSLPTLGTAAAQNTGAFEASGAISTHAALTTTHGISVFGASLVDDANASTARATLGLGGAAVLNVGTGAGTVTAGDDVRLSDARTPVVHAHVTGDITGFAAAALAAAPAETASTIGSLISAAADKTTPVDADNFALSDSAAANSLKRLSWVNVKTALAAVFARLAGTAGGQTLIGGTAASENLTLLSTSNATKGAIIFGSSSEYDHANERLGIGTLAPAVRLHAISTAEQMRLGYDASNYVSTTVSATGLVTIAGTLGQYSLAGPTAEQATATLGAELITNPSFASDLSGWTAGTGWSWAAGGALHTGGNTATLAQDESVANGTTYQLDIAISGRTAGSIAVALGAVSVIESGTSTAFTATSSRTVIAGATGTVSLAITPTTDFNGTIDSVSLKLVTLGSFPVAMRFTEGGSAGAELRQSLARSNTSIGNGAGRSITTGTQNACFGSGAGYSLTTGSSNINVGHNAGRSITVGKDNSNLGREAGFSITTGGANCNFGVASGYSITTGGANSNLGRDAGGAITTGSSNTNVGLAAGRLITTGGQNSNIGRDAGAGITTGSNNTCIGRDGGRYIADGSTSLSTPSNCVFIGTLTKASANGVTAENVFGYNAIGIGSNTTCIGASSNTKTQICGDIVLDKTVTAGGTTGAQTINKTCGSVNFAAGATSLVVTDSRVTTASVIVATVATNDATMKTVLVVAAAGSFTLHANAAATAETRVNFLVIN